ncbi:uncharacterized protein LOC131239735 isoform X3 [Magnolia sinica]|uniref:uncharacterized protein LOC131239735 isoform X3 n=1 Tax=Magnolia sinica TaxID=86752 RepID=UPI0026588E6F|nr:uncharacterized protein LOC131239735 isoform X3 [Magnolia sinica]
MAQILPPCPPNSFSLNSTVCVCNPGYFMNPARNDCTLFTASPNEWAVGSGVEYGPFFPETIFSFDSIKKFTQSQAIFLEATMVVLVSWLAFCLAVRFGKIDGGRTIWFRIRWWISRWDVCYATRHWLDDRKVVTKRKTELGGSFSVASWILFIGLLAALLYQIITKRTVEVHKIKPANGPDLSSFINDMEFNITTISSMSCSHLRGLGTLVTGTPGFVDYRVSPLSIFASYYCQNTSRGPTVTLKCSNCQVPRDGYYISWQFVDLQNDPATAVGFQFNLTAKKHGDNKHVSFVTGILKSRGNMDERPNTFRGADVNVLKFHLFPRVYRNLNNLSLLQPLFRDFLPGSSFFETSQLKTSLQSSKDGLINTTLHVNFISDYIVEIDNENALGPVGFLSNVGGLYVFCITVFFYCMLLFEHRIKKLRREDAVLRDIRSRRRAQLRWDKLRKYVMYTWGPDDLDGEGKYSTKEQSCGKSFHGIGSLRKQKTQSRMDSIKIDKSIGSTIETKIIPGATQTEMVKTRLAQGTSDLERKLSKSEGAYIEKNMTRSQLCLTSIQRVRGYSQRIS